MTLVLALMRDAHALLAAGSARPEEALAAYDALPPMPVEGMWGRWRGSGLHTNHPMDGLLEHYGWYGKEFIDADHVHPLIFHKGKGTVTLEPRLLFMGLDLPPAIARSGAVRQLFGLLQPLLTTRQARARVRMTEFRGCSTATMCYDHLPIHDVFRKVDDDSLLGIMDLKGLTAPFFFVLRRERR